MRKTGRIAAGVCGAVMMTMILAGPALADPSVNSPVGSLDGIVFSPGGDIEARGWAADVDDITAVVTVRYYIDGIFVENANTTGESRPDVLAVTGAPNAGFRSGLYYGDEGVHTLCAYGLNVGANGTNALLGCRQFGTPRGSSTPFGSFDSLTFRTDGSPVVRGWAADGDQVRGRLDVAVWVDGVRGYPLQTGTEARTDVSRAVGATAAGFLATLAPQGPGVHSVCVYGINVGPGANAQIGCRSYGQNQVSPQGSVEPLQFFADGSPVVYGWAADAEAIGEPLDIHLYVDGVFRQFARTGNHPRPDVTAATGAPQAGFVAVLAPQGPGPHTVCAYAINIGPTGDNALVGCRGYGGGGTPPVVIAPRGYASCAQLWVDYPRGVGRPGAVDTNGNPPNVDFTRNEAVYNLNTARDADGDGIACETVR